MRSNFVSPQPMSDEAKVAIILSAALLLSIAAISLRVAFVALCVPSAVTAPELFVTNSGAGREARP